MITTRSSNRSQHHPFSVSGGMEEGLQKKVHVGRSRHYGHNAFRWRKRQRVQRRPNTQKGTSKSKSPREPKSQPYHLWEEDTSTDDTRGHETQLITTRAVSRGGNETKKTRTQTRHFKKQTSTDMKGRTTDRRETKEE